ncbi:MAG: flagellar M-ring protein FliF, partial [Pseudomonadota bacterium]|nr:flagellar M-ring protein FliF [Pseudomonadota bacterium]
MAEPLVRADQNPPAAPFDWRARVDRLRRAGPPKPGVLVGVAAAVAVAVALALWSSAAGYAVLYRGLPEADAGQIMEALQQHDIPFRVDNQTGVVEVPAGRVYETRLKLAAQGLPRGAVAGFEQLDRENGFGTSQFMEAVRHQRALEGELARSIMSIGAVREARVHLALPRESVFVRERQPPGASVLVQLHPGRALDPGQVAAIVHLVASSVPRLTADRVSVVDQTGSLLTRPGSDLTLAMSLDQLELTRRLEERYVRRIEDILTPLLGAGRVRAQVALDMDFTAVEQTAERFGAG